VLYESALGPSAEGRPLHTAVLLEEVGRAAAAAGGWQEVERIAVGLGPGIFTGLRVGIATAKGLGLARGLPVRGAGTLDALARGLGEAAPDRARVAAIDARRGEVYAAAWSADGEHLWGPLIDRPGKLAERLAALPRAAICGGSGAIRFRQQLASRGVEIPDDADPVHRVAARHVCALATAAADEEEAAPVAPIYVRPPDAQRWRERDSPQEP
jgi:tRNA threonylcarbamoyladenosine biosynthesis protein TsaB